MKILLLTFLLLLLLLLLCYIGNCSKTIFVNENFPNKKELRILTYNIQRLPHLFRPSIDIADISKKTDADIICLQEDFRNIGTCYRKDGYNVFHPGMNQVCRVADSGLTVYSKLKAKNVEFVTFHQSCGVDSFAQKGFIVIDFDDFVLVNTHMQSVGEQVQQKQKEQISKYLFAKYPERKVFVTGDFNIDLREARMEGYKTIIPSQPTFIEKDKKCNNVYYFLDGAFVKDIRVVSVQEGTYDKYADHLGVLIDIVI